MKAIELKIKITNTKGKPKINLECDKNIKLDNIISILEGTHKKILESTDSYFKKHPVRSKAEMLNVFNKLKIKDLESK